MLSSLLVTSATDLGQLCVCVCVCLCVCVCGVCVCVCVLSIPIIPPPPPLPDTSQTSAQVILNSLNGLFQMSEASTHRMLELVEEIDIPESWENVDLIKQTQGLMVIRGRGGRGRGGGGSLLLQSSFVTSNL